MLFVIKTAIMETFIYQLELSKSDTIQGDYAERGFLPTSKKSAFSVQSKNLNFGQTCPEDPGQYCPEIPKTTS